MQKKNLLTVVAFAFIMSGVCGLIYEVVWAKYLALFIGNTTYAHTVVLATFMAGLAAGAYYWGRKADSVLSRLRLYGILEILIGLYCFLYPTLLRLLEKAYIYTVVATDSPSNSILVLALKLSVSVVSLFLPTFLMGGTLPILVKFLTRRLEDTGKDVAILYFLNSFGAVLGSFFAGFLLIEVFGLRYSVYIAAIINTIIGIGIYIISLREREDLTMEAVGVEETPVSEISYSKTQIQIAIAAAALSGFSSMVYELTWIRLLSLILGSSTYSFSLMLMAFISGITLGSYIVSKFIHKVKNLFTFLGYCELAVGVAMVAVLPIYQRLPYYFWVLGDIVNRTPQGYVLFIIIEYIFCFLLMFLPTLFLGMALPIISRIVTNDIKFVGKSVGSIFSINTLGTVGGSLMTGLVFIPWMGVHYSIQLGIVINLILSSLIFITGAGKLMKRSLAPAIGWVLLVIYVMNMPEWNRSTMAYGVFRSMQKRRAPSSYAEFVRMNEQNKVMYYKEGVNATVAVVEQDSQLILTVNGKADASSRGDLMTQLLLGHLPAVVAPKMDNALVIGLGSGITAGAVAQHPVQHL
ncbi:MAG TPA: fused MFS/spermidine synthase, partial [Bacteroidota bacterium]|nr:fused MFS/spermidine synthase [Bacteroidota bacterium]